MQFDTAIRDCDNEDDDNRWEIHLLMESNFFRLNSSLTDASVDVHVKWIKDQVQSHKL